MMARSGLMSPAAPSAITPSANVQSLLGAANYAAIRTLLGLGDVALETAPLAIGKGGTGGTLGERGFAYLGGLASANLNTTNDQAITLLAGIGKYRVRQIMAFDASANLSASAAQGGIYSAASKAGVAVVAASQVYTTLSAPTKVLSLTISAAALADYLTAATLYLSLSSPHGVAATCALLVFGDVLG